MDNRMDDFQYLVEAERFDLTQRIDEENDADTLDVIFRQLNLPGKKLAAKREALACILANLIYSHWQDKPVRYSRRKPTYSLPKRYGKPWFTYTNIVKTIDQLEERGLIECRRGFCNSNGRSFSSRMCPTPRLLDQAGHLFLKTEPIRELVRLKGINKKLIDYEETEETQAMRIFLAHYNNLLDTTEMKLVVPGEAALNKKSVRVIKENYFKL